jgi:HAE1 family hydrophobic/amphiphilic exporter-1
MLIGILVVLGFVSYTKLGLHIFPELSFPAVSILTTYRGVAPEDIENLITKPIEEAVSTISGVKKVTSFSMEEISVVTVEFEWGRNLDFAAQDCRDKIGLIEGFLPEGASKPLVLKFDVNMIPVMEYYAYSEKISSDVLRKILKDQVKGQLERLDGVASVFIMGGREREIWIEVDRGKLKDYGISLQEIVQALSLQNLNLPAGHIIKGQKEYLLRAVGEFERIEDIRDAVVGVTPGGIPIYLRNIAKIYETFEEKRGYFRVDGRETAFFDVYKQSGTNTVKVADRVKKQMEEIKKTLPEHIKFEVAFDQSKIIKRVTSRTSQNAILGALFAALMILFFLRNWRPTLVISLAIPLSVIITFIVVYFAGYTLNMMTLGGIALGVGMLVDNAVVVLENIFRRLEEGEDRERAAIEGTKEVGTAISAATFTNIVVFLPLIYVGGIVGKLAQPLALSVSTTLLASLFVAITIIPMLARVFLKERRREEYGGAYGETWFNPVRNIYRKMLAFVLRHRILTLVLATVIFIISFLLIPKIGLEFMPQMDREFGMIQVELPPGTPLEETDHFIKQIEKIAHEYEDVLQVSAIVGETPESEQGAAFFGTSGVNTAVIFISFVEKKMRKEPSYKTISEILARIPEYKGAKISSMDFMRMMFLGAEAKPIQIKLFGRDLSTLKELALRIKREISQVEGVVRPEISLEEAKPELRIIVNRSKAAQFGLTPYQIENEIQIAEKGVEATQLRERGEEIPIKVMLDTYDRKDIEDIFSLEIKTPMGFTVPLKEVADFEFAYGPIRIDREKQMRVVSVLAENEKRSVGMIMRDIAKKLSGIKMPAGYVMEFAGEFERIKEMIKDMFFALSAAFLLIYMIMAAQFESFKDPFIVMFTLPLAVIGVLLLFLITGTTISVVSLMGVLILSGVVVNNAIVMIDYIKKLRKRGVPDVEAVIEGATVRLRPILITALTTIIGMIPMAVSRSEGWEMRAPMALAVIGGLLTSTLLTLFIIPTVYTIFERIRTR